MSLRRLLPLLGNRSVDLVRAGYLHPAFTVSRASAKSAILNGLFTEYAAGVPAFDDLGLSIHEQRLNGNPNPRMIGVVPGSPGTLPTGTAMDLGSPTNGLTRTIIGVQTIKGAPYFVFEISGIASSPTAVDYHPTNSFTTAKVVQGNSISLSSSLILLSGSQAGVTVRNILTEVSGGGSTLVSQDGAARTLGTTPPAQPYSDTFTVLNVGTAWAMHRIRLLIASGTDFTTPARFAFGLPCNELGAFSTPIPMPATTGAATRLLDNISAILTPLGLPPAGFTLSGSVLWSEAGVTKRIFSLDDGAGTGINSYLIEQSSGGNNIRLWRSTAGASVGALAGTFTPGVLLKFAVAVNPVTGTAALSLNGAAAVGVSGGPGGMTKLWLGQSPTGTQSLNGYLPILRALPYAASGAQLQALSLAA